MHPRQLCYFARLRLVGSKWQERNGTKKFRTIAIENTIRDELRQTSGASFVTTSRCLNFAAKNDLSWLDKFATSHRFAMEHQTRFLILFGKQFLVGFPQHVDSI